MAITVTRTVTGPNDDPATMQHTVQVREHRITADVSAAEGGVDAGPDPHDLYDAALGACKALTVLWFAKRKAIPLEGVQVTIERDKSEERNGVYRISAALALSGSITDAQRESLLAVAQKCPVHKLMSDVKTEITTTLVPKAGA